MKKLTVSDLQVAGQRVLVRVDFNVPMAEGTIADDGRIRAALPTLELLLNRGASLVLMSHLGRPKGERVSSLSLAPCAERLAKLLGRPVQMASDCVGFTLPGMMELPGSFAGILISPIPQRGPEASQRMSLAIFIKEAAKVFSTPLISTKAS